MQKVLTAAEMREVDRLTIEKYGIPSLLLMENAAHAAARIIAEKLSNSVADNDFLIVCGKGNNGGDGAVLARILWTQGASVNLVLIGKVEETSGDARTNFEIAKKLSNAEIFKIVGTKVVIHNELIFDEVSSIEEWKKCLENNKYNYFDPDVLVDALFGTGLNKPLTEIYEEVADYIRTYNFDDVREKTLVVSIDIPSGLDADKSVKIGTNPNAHLTVTFTAPKLANVLAPASRFNGELVTVNIGSPGELIENSPSQLFLAEKSDAQDWLRRTKFTADSHKTARGRVLIVAGSKAMPGAAVLAANAAMMSGAGLVRVATSESAQNAVASRIVAEAMVAGLPETDAGAISFDALETVLELAKKADVAAIGSGLSSDDDSTKKLVREFVERRKFPVVIDADGLNSLAPFDVQGSDDFPLILTPHIGEMRQLLGVDNSHDFSDRVGIVRAFAQKHHVILVLKGERSLIAAPDGRVVVNPTGNAGLGKAGSGDTLAGIITSFVAQGIAGANRVDVFESVVAALYVSGLAGDIAAEKFGMRTMIPTNVRECLSEAFAALEG